jgi:hypothetical protein
LIKDSPDMPRNLGFRSDVRRKITYRNLSALYGGPPGVEASKTVALALAVLKKLGSGASLAFPGHVLNAADYVLIMGQSYIGIPSRVPQWLYDNGLINAEGRLTNVGKLKSEELASS